MLYQTHAKVHLGNIRRNIEGIRAAIGNDCKMLIAVKANAYGHGAVAVSKMAEKIGVDYLGIATVPEGIMLRDAGILLPILKFSPAFPEELEAAARANISLAICSRENASDAETVCARLGLKSKVHLKVDTGMGRVGVSASEASALALFIEKECSHLTLEGIFTHLPVSDSDDVIYTQKQIEFFKDTIASVEKSIGRRIEIAHAANSGAVLGHAASYLNMVRPGIMIYGYYPDTQTPKTIPLFPGMSFVSRVSFIKKVKEGTSIGYGRSWVAKEDTVIATVPAGYADGFNRLFSNSGRVLINGASYSVVGRVCMDQFMVNLGASSNVKVGDEVVLMGKSGKEAITCYEWAEKLKTITYEVTCQINSRVERVYDTYEK